MEVKKELTQCKISESEINPVAFDTTHMKLLSVSDYPEITEDMLRNSRDPWLIMDDEGLNTINKRSTFGIWKKNQDADLMRMGKRSAFNDDMVILLHL